MYCYLNDHHNELCVVITYCDSQWRSLAVQVNQLHRLQFLVLFTLGYVFALNIYPVVWCDFWRVNFIKTLNKLTIYYYQNDKKSL